jgi:hypothetical protein
MSSTSIEFHKIWLDQCAATEGIVDHFGLENALDYLIGEKLLHHIEAAQTRAQWADELPAFAAEIKKIFTAKEIIEYLAYLERAKHFRANRHRVRTMRALLFGPFLIK